METTCNRILDGRVLLCQPRRGFRSGSDAVLLAAAAHPAAGGRVLELGCGTALPLLCLGWRRPDLWLVGLELQPAIASLAAANLRRNAMTGRGAVVVGDVARPPFRPASFDLVIANPPYFVEGRFRRSPDAARDLGRAETSASLGRWVEAALTCLKAGGHAVFILRRERLGDFLGAASGAGAVDILPLAGRPGRPAKRVLLRLDPAGTGRLEHPPLMLHDESGADTTLAQAVFRHAAPIFWPRGL